MRKGLFITLEGPDGCGKSTQAVLLSEHLKKGGHQVVLTREPGGTPLAEEIRRVILTPDKEVLDPLAETLLYTAARVQHVTTVIRPALEAGKIVLCERFIDSTLAYQGYGLGRDLELIRKLNQMAVGSLQPDLTVLFDLEVLLCSERVLQRNLGKQSLSDRIEARGSGFQEKVRQGFLELAKNEPRFSIIEVTEKSIAKIQRELLKVVESKLGEINLV